MLSQTNDMNALARKRAGAYCPVVRLENSLDVSAVETSKATEFGRGLDVPTVEFQ